MSQLFKLAEALKDHNVDFVDVSVIPFTDEFVTPIDEAIVGRRIIPYGSTSLIKNAKRRGWSGTYFDPNTFRSDAWNANRTDMLNQHAQVMTVCEAVQEFGNRPSDDVYFIRPIMDLKEFNGTVTTAGEIARWMSSVDSGNFSFSPDTVVSVAPPVNIMMEWRHFIVNRKVVTSAHYKHKGVLHIGRELDAAVIEEAQYLADGWLPHDCCVMDTALTEDGVKVVEFNTINGSGFYEHDIGAFVKALTEYEERRII